MFLNENILSIRKSLMLSHYYTRLIHIYVSSIYNKCMHHTMNGERVHRIYLQFENLPRSIFSMLIFIQQIYNFHGENFMHYNNMQNHQIVYCIIETYHVILRGLCTPPPPPPTQSRNTPTILFTHRTKFFFIKLCHKVLAEYCWVRLIIVYIFQGNLFTSMNNSDRNPPFFTKLNGVSQLFISNIK